MPTTYIIPMGGMQICSGRAQYNLSGATASPGKYRGASNDSKKNHDRAAAMLTGSVFALTMADNACAEAVYIKSQLLLL